MADTYAMSRSIHELRPMSAWLREAMSRCGLSPASSHILELCTNEALANVLMHADGDPRDPIKLAFECAGGLFRLMIAERSRAFDPLSAALPQAENNLETAIPSGRGLTLIRRLLPQSSYERKGEENVLVLKGRLR